MKNHWEAGCIRQMFSFLWLVCSHLTRYRNRKSIRLSISEPLDRRGRVYSVHMCVHACFSSVMPKGDLTDSLACDAGGKQKNIKAIFSRTVFSESWGRWQREREREDVVHTTTSRRSSRQLHTCLPILLSLSTPTSRRYSLHTPFSLFFLFFTPCYHLYVSVSVYLSHFSLLLAEMFVSFS